MSVRTLELDEIEKAIEIYACKKFGIAGAKIKLCVDYDPYTEIDHQVTIIAKIETGD